MQRKEANNSKRKKPIGSPKVGRFSKARIYEIPKELACSDYNKRAIMSLQKK